MQRPESNAVGSRWLGIAAQIGTYLRTNMHWGPRSRMGGPGSFVQHQRLAHGNVPLIEQGSATHTGRIKPFVARLPRILVQLNPAPRPKITCPTLALSAAARLTDEPLSSHSCAPALSPPPCTLSHSIPYATYRPLPQRPSFNSFPKCVRALHGMLFPRFLIPTYRPKRWA